MRTTPSAKVIRADPFPNISFRASFPSAPSPLGRLFGCGAALSAAGPARSSARTRRSGGSRRRRCPRRADRVAGGFGAGRIVEDEDDHEPDREAGEAGPAQITEQQPLRVGKEQHHGDRREEGRIEHGQQRQSEDAAQVILSSRVRWPGVADSDRYSPVPVTVARHG